jgi:signal transduction histidine kinase
VTRNRLSEDLAYLSGLPENERDFFLAVVAEGLAHCGELDRVVKRKERKALMEALAERGVDGSESAAELIADIGAEKTVLTSGAVLNSPELKNLLARARDLVCLAKMVEVISVASGKAIRVVEAVRGYVSGHKADGEGAIDLGTEIEAILTLYHNRIKHGVEIKKDVRAGVLVRGDRALINLVWICLIDNALEAMNFAGAMELDVKNDGDWVIVSVTDSGPGIPDSIGERVFDPRFSTKEKGKRAGIGLDTCARIIRAHGGEIGFESRPGETRFTVRLKPFAGNRKT